MSSKVYVRDFEIESYNDVHPKIILFKGEFAEDIAKILLLRFRLDFQMEINGVEYEGMYFVRQALDQQGVMQYIGSNTGLVSAVFHVGGQPVPVQGHIIDITSQAQNPNTSYIVDTYIDIRQHVFIYRIINYSYPNAEIATRYAGGLLLPSGVFMETPSDTEEIPLDEEDTVVTVPVQEPSDERNYFSPNELEELFPENHAAVTAWAKENSLFRETYKLRKRGIIEQHKLNSYISRNFVCLDMLFKVQDKIDSLQQQIETGILEL